MSFEELSQIDDFVNWRNIEQVMPKITEADYAPLDKDGGLPKGLVRLRLSPEPCGENEEKAYLAENLRGEKLLIRTQPIKYYGEAGEIAALTDRLVTEGRIITARPREVGACCDDTLVYSVYRWIEGVNLSEALEQLPAPEKYQCGVKAGRLLKKIHGIGAFRRSSDSATPLKKAQTLAADFCGRKISFQGSENALSILKTELEKGGEGLPGNRPYTVLHGDFYIDRIFVAANGSLGLKPLQSACYGDPAWDFAPIFKNGCSAFMRGQLKGYFGDGVPGDFFGLLRLYAAMYAMRAAMDESGGSALAEKISAAYDGFTLKIPLWY